MKWFLPLNHQPLSTHLLLPTAHETVSPTAPPTPTLLSTPPFVTATHQTYLLEDHFDAQRFDGSYNSLLWTCSGCSSD